jgi:diaminohydroxyphosphoribosylaminopyrimidine deaminase/5-amino-6-(5-phosphoribosylamino)uracil reductase
LIRAGVARVVAATLDFNPQVHGQGVRQLREAGVQVDVGLLATPARELNAGFEQRMLTGRPRVTVKIGASLDGRTALSNGESRWITGEPARADVQRLRAASSAVVTGIGTVLADDPQLTVRDPAIDLLGRMPLRVVLDSRLRMPADARMLQLPGETLVLTSEQGAEQGALLTAAGATVRVIDRDESGGVGLPRVLALLGELQCNDVLVEAGATLSGRFMELGLVDELIVYMAPSLLGPLARPMLQLPALANLADRIQWRFHGHERIGDDLRLVLRPVART